MKRNITIYLFILILLGICLGSISIIKISKPITLLSLIYVVPAGFLIYYLFNLKKESFLWTNITFGAMALVPTASFLVNLFSGTEMGMEVLFIFIYLIMVAIFWALFASYIWIAKQDGKKLFN